jgi:zinc protease
MKARWLTVILVCCFQSAWAGSEYHKTLDNGLNVYVIEDHRSPVVYSSLWYRVGSADEVNGQTGLSHMLEHMLFRGTKNTRDGEYAEVIHGLGGQMNAMTSEDFTLYYSYIPVSGLPKVLELEADRMRHLVVTEALLKREKEVVKEEREMRVSDNPSSMLSERLDAAAFVSSPYHNPVIGWPDDVASYTVSDVTGWYDQWYRPNNATLILVGDLTAESGFALAKKYFGLIPGVKLPIRKLRAEVPPLGQKRLLVHYPAKVATLNMGYLVPGLAQMKNNDWEAYALEVLAGVLDATPASRLNQHLIRDRMIASSISVNYDSMHRHQSLFLIRGVPAHGQSMTQVEQSIKEEIEKLQENEVSRAELNRVKAQVVAHAVFQKDSLESQAMNIGIPLMALLPWDMDHRWVERIEAVTPKQVRWVATHYLTDMRLTVGYLEPTAVK